MGIYGGWRWEYSVREGNPLMTYAAQVFIKVYDWLLSNMKRSNAGRVRLAADLSHGINFMPLLVFRACRAACRMLAALTGVEIKVLTYNSEPYPPGKIVERPGLNIHRIESDIITPTLGASLASDTLLMYWKKLTLIKVSGKPEGKVKEIRERTDKLRENLIAANIIRYNLPLAAVYYTVAEGRGSGDGVLEILREAVEAFKEETDVDRAEKKVVHRISLEYDVAKAVAASEALSRYVE